MVESQPATYEFVCNNLYPDCTTKISGRDEEEVWKKARRHVREHHGVRDFHDETVRNIRMAIRVA